MFYSIVLIPLSFAALVVARTEPHASAFAGSTSAAVFPPPGATIIESDTFFPDATEVGFAGPTPTGDEAEAIETAGAFAKHTDTYPLTEPFILKPNGKSSQSGSFNPIRHWGNLSPWFSVDPGDFGLPDASPQVPGGCDLLQVHLLHRHGARYPTTGSGPSSFSAKIHAAANGTGFSASGPLEFLNTWTYKLGAELLTPFGREQLFDLGVGFRVKYGDLLKGFTDLPVFRTTSEARMVDSALHFAAGFFGVQQYTTSYHQLITVEAGNVNNTLAPYEMCPTANGPAGQLGSQATAAWTAIYLNKTTARLQRFVRGVDLTTTDTYAMQSLCAYETVALGFSAFCGLFTEQEWKGYEYSLDLGFWYSEGPGTPNSAAQGIGYVQELLSRLTQQRLTEFNTTVNGTVVSSETTFPLDQPIFVDATHDTVISSIVVAMNFTSMAANGPLPLDHIPEKQTYLVQRIAPFASNLVGQILSCPASHAKQNATADKQKFIRWILNDGVVPLTGIAHCPSNKNGLCPLDAFVQGMREREAEVDFAHDCFGNYTVSVPNDIVDGRAPR